MRRKYNLCSITAYRLMRDHRTILKQLFKAQGATLIAIAQEMGWKSPRTVAWKLSGKRDWSTGELEKMCEIAGITIVRLAEMADDLTLAKHAQTITVARIVDDLPLTAREAVLQYAQSIKDKTND